MNTRSGDIFGSTISDGSLLRRFQNGQQDAATALYVKYAQRLIALARAQTADNLASRFDAEDVVQSVFRTFFRRAAEGLYEVPPGDELWKLFVVLSLNKIRKLAAFHKAQKRNVQTTQAGVAAEALPPGSSGDEAESLAILEMVIEELLSTMPESHRQIVELRIEQHGVDQIAELTKRSVRTVERVLCNFRNRLASLIQEDVPGQTADQPAVDAQPS